MATQTDDIRNLDTIPVGSLGIIPLESCRELGEKVDYYLVNWRTVRENELRTVVSRRCRRSIRRTIPSH